MSDIRRKRFMDGRISAEEFHSKYAFPPDAHCHCCSARPVMRLMVFIPVDELEKRDPAFKLLMTLQPEVAMKMIVQFKHGPHVRTITMYACASHQTAAEQAIRGTPSWAVVEINRGPGTDKLVVGGGCTLPT